MSKNTSIMAYFFVCDDVKCGFVRYNEYIKVWRCLDWVTWSR